MNSSIPDDLEFEFGVPIPGKIKPQNEWAHTALKKLPAEGTLDFAALFGRTAPVVLELGCGNARYTLMSAIARPDHDHLAVDVLPAVIRYATRRANQRGLSNTRFAVKDAQTFMKQYVAPQSVAEIHVYHPQPFHDHKQWRRRLITPRFLMDVHRALKAGGLLVIQTDSPEYWRYMLGVVPAFFEFQEHSGPWEDAPEGRSRREIVANERGLPVCRGFGSKRELSAEEVSEFLKVLPPPNFRTRRPRGPIERGDE